MDYEKRFIDTYFYVVYVFDYFLIPYAMAYVRESKFFEF